MGCVLLYTSVVSFFFMNFYGSQYGGMKDRCLVV